MPKGSSNIALELEEEGRVPVVNVKQVSHVALKTPHLERQAAFYADIVGLGETERDGAGRVYLRCNANHHAVALIPADTSGMDHYALDVGGPAEVEHAAAALHKADIPFEADESKEAGQGPALRLRDPDGYVIELIGEMDQVAPSYGPRAVQPRKLGHVTLLVADCKRSEKFYSEVLGFRVSDWMEDQFLWMRCNPDHHGVAFAKADRVALHHFAFEVLDFAQLARQADHLMYNGHQLFYGPGRHGPGQNQFAYFKDPEGQIVEFTCDVQQIWDDANYTPRVWSSQAPWVNMWGPNPPADFV